MRNPQPSDRAEEPHSYDVAVLGSPDSAAVQLLPRPTTRRHGRPRSDRCGTARPPRPVTPGSAPSWTRTGSAAAVLTPHYAVAGDQELGTAQ
jgi:hypothetical protein